LFALESQGQLAAEIPGLSNFANALHWSAVGLRTQARKAPRASLFRILMVPFNISTTTGIATTLSNWRRPSPTITRHCSGDSCPTKFVTGRLPRILHIGSAALTTTVQASAVLPPSNDVSNRDLGQPRTIDGRFQLSWRRHQAPRVAV
jgi:hypothetical protein